MRHLVGLILALAMSAAIFFGAGWSSARILAAHAAGTSLVNASGGEVLAALLGTGLLLGILVAAPLLSPLGAGLPGLVLLAWSAVHVVNAHLALRLIPLSGHTAATGFRAMLIGGMLAMLGGVMIVPMFVPSRWRSREPEDEFAAAAQAELVH
ncbi:MAG TPA: hypothetical protein VLM11_16660 [Streptosporangiaceae bacterium]|nr:hypothetical protein [Streptosporangiaceae bacterium]